MNTQATELQTDIKHALGLSDMSDQERSDFFEQIGSMAIESALLRFMVGLEMAEKKAFETWLDRHDDLDALLKDAEQDYPELAMILDEEVTAMHESIVAMI